MHYKSRNPFIFMVLIISNNSNKINIALVSKVSRITKDNYVPLYTTQE